jgi:hypothetical protein
MAQLLNNFENGLADGTTITTTNSDNGTAGDAFDFVTGGGAVVVDTGITLHGTRTGLFTASASTAIVYWNPVSPAGEIWTREYFYVADATPAADTTIFDLNGTDDTTAALDMRLRTTGKLRFRIPSTVRYSDSTVTLSDNTWYRLEVHAKFTATDTVAAECRIFYGANLEGSTPDETMGDITTGFTATGAGTTFGQISWGVITSGTGTFSKDSLGYSDVEWLGSVVPAAAGRRFWGTPATLGTIVASAGFGTQTFGTSAFGGS